MSDFLIYDQHEGVVTLTMNRPEIRNAIAGMEQAGEFEEVCDRINRDMTVGAVILTGAGKSFCAGGNVKDMRDGKGHSADTSVEVRDNFKIGVQRIPLAFHKLEAPLIGAVNGAAIGVGCDLVCMCDIRIASEYAKFAASFVKIGIAPGDGGAWWLPRAVGMAKASEMVFTGDVIDAAEALACGLVSKVVPAEKLMDEVGDLAARIAANPHHALRLSKRLLRESEHLSLESLLELSAAFQGMLYHTEDRRKAVAALVETLEARSKKG